jgi:plastocyanin
MAGKAAAVMLLLALILGGCTARTDGPVATNRVEMPRSYRFEPAVIQVAPGTTVTWHNGDNFTHTVQFQDGIDQSLNLAPGESGTIRFDLPGEYDYICTLHRQQMTGRVIVTNP